MPDESSGQESGDSPPRCPSCGHELKKTPKRKTKCPFCGEFMLVRTRPSDRAKVLVTEEQADQIDLEWRAGDQATRDRKWAECNKQLLEHATNRNWGFYRNARLDMAELLAAEGKTKEALQAYLEICYLDLNGPNNQGGGLGDLRPDFDPEDGFLAPAVVYGAAEAAEELGFDLQPMAEIFEKHNSAVQERLRLPLVPRQAWQKLRTELLREGVSEA